MERALRLAAICAGLAGRATAAPVDIATAPVLNGPDQVRWVVDNTGGTDTGQPPARCGCRAST